LNGQAVADILIVDDEPINRELLRTLLAYGGHRLFEAADGREALDVVRAERPDLVIADILMPTMDGYEFVRQLRADADIAATPVIFYTAHYLEREAHELATRCGVEHILTKPSEPEVILHTVAAALGTARSTPAPPAPIAAQFDREHLQVLSDTLARKVEEMQSINRRLGALVEVAERLALERDPGRLLADVTRMARRMIGARYALVAVLDNGNGGWKHVVASGLPSETTARLTHPPSEHGVLNTLLRDATAVRLTGPQATVTDVGLPAEFPPFDSLLAVRVNSPSRQYGWLCLTDHLGGDGFSAEDERLAVTLGSLAGRVYENGSLYTEVRRSAEALQALNAELEERVAERTAALDAANHELETFSFSVSHDLRSPLRHIEGFSRLLLEEHAAQLDTEGQQHLQRICAGTQRMGQLISDLLALARVARQEIQRQPVSLSELATSIVAELRESDPTRTVTVEVQPDLAAVADVHLLRVALENLLANAWKYTRKSLDPRITFGAEVGDAGPVYFVHDNGAGFDMAFVDRLFVAFQRLHSESEFEGTGIGLATVQRIVQRHGGRVWAESDAQRGTIFRFTLGPASASNSNEAGA
jgi:signal transduction histidine kinase/CheY-like chemotaxis protein